MVKIDVPYLERRAGAGGKFIYYWVPATRLRRQGWKVQRLSDDLDQAVDEARALNAELNTWRKGTASTDLHLKPPAQPAPATPYVKAGTIGALIAEYKTSRFWKKLKPNTKARYLSDLKLIEEWSNGGTAPIQSITPARVQMLYEKFYEKTPRKAAGVVAMLRNLMEYARRTDKIAVNPAAQPGISYDPTDPVIWPREAVAHYVATADKMGWWSVGTAVMLNEWFGQRKPDLLELSRKIYRNGGFHFKQGKTGARVILPIDLVPHLVQRLEEEFARQAGRGISGTAILISERTGQPFNKNTFTQTFAEIRAEAAKAMPRVVMPFDPEIAEPFEALWFSRLRHTAVTRLADAGCEVPQIAAVTGHTPSTVHKILNHYLVATAEQAKEAFLKRLHYERGKHI